MSRYQGPPNWRVPHYAPKQIPICGSRAGVSGVPSPPQNASAINAQ